MPVINNNNKQANTKNNQIDLANNRLTLEANSSYDPDSFELIQNEPVRIILVAKDIYLFKYPTF